MMERPAPKWLGGRAKGAAGAHPEGLQPAGRDTGVIDSAGVVVLFAIGGRGTGGDKHRPYNKD